MGGVVSGVSCYLYLVDNYRTFMLRIWSYIFIYIYILAELRSHEMGRHPNRDIHVHIYKKN